MPIAQPWFQQYNSTIDLIVSHLKKNYSILVYSIPFQVSFWLSQGISAQGKVDRGILWAGIKCSVYLVEFLSFLIMRLVPVCPCSGVVGTVRIVSRTWNHSACRVSTKLCFQRYFAKLVDNCKLFWAFIFFASTVMNCSIRNK